MGISALLPFLALAERPSLEAAKACLDGLLAHEHALIFSNSRDAQVDKHAAAAYDASTFPLPPLPRITTWRAARRALTRRADKDMTAAISAFDSLGASCGYQRASPVHSALVSSSTEANLAFPQAIWEPSWPSQVGPKPAARVTSVAYRFLRYNQYPQPFRFVHWGVSGNELGWRAPAAEGTALSPYGLSPSNDDLPSTMHTLTLQEHGHAIRAYRIVELAHDIRWLASASFDGAAAAIKKLKPARTDLAQQLLAARVGEFFATATEWAAYSAAQSNAAKHRADKMHAFREIASLNEKRADAAMMWRSLALRWHAELRQAAPRATLASIVEIIAERLQHHEEKVSPKAIYMFLWKIDRQQRVHGGVG